MKTVTGKLGTLVHLRGKAGYLTSDFPFALSSEVKSPNTLGQVKYIYDKATVTGQGMQETRDGTFEP